MQQHNESSFISSSYSNEYGNRTQEAVAGAGGAARKILGIEEAMEWLPHGKGFRILRYEKLVQYVLPIAFPTLCDDSGGSRNNGSTTRTTRTTMTDDGGRRKTAAVMKEERGNNIVVTMDGRGHINTITTNNAAADDGGLVSNNKQQQQEQAKYYSDNVWVDSFLWHMKAWGFQEVTMGVDRGSFRHEVRHYR
jgi:hypothetical protein